MKPIFGSRARREQLSSAPATASGDRVYAIGDVHGRADLLRLLIARIDAHERGLPAAAPPHLVLLGDLIDRGPDSAGVLEIAQSLQLSRPNVAVLLGNHEQVLLDVLGGVTAALQAWMDFGGEETLASFGVAMPSGGADPRDTIAALREAVAPATAAWLNGLPLSLRSGDYFFCHAGLRPGVPLLRQSREDLLWIRDDFLNSDADHGVVVVHGHSVVHTVEQRANRIGIDTGAYASNRLTALYLDGATSEVLTVEG